MKPKKRSDSSTASIEELSRTSGRSWRFTKKRLQECGLFPPDKHPRRLLLAALRRPEPTDAATSVRERKTFEEWRNTMSITLDGSFHCIKACLPSMLERRSGNIITLGGDAVLLGGNRKAHNTTAKNGLVGLTRALAGTHASEGVRVNAICSGLVLTDRIIRNFGYPGDGGTVPDIRDSATRGKGYPFWIGQPEDVAHIAVFLASDESRMITGASIAADGGRSSY